MTSQLSFPVLVGMELAVGALACCVLSLGFLLCYFGRNRDILNDYDVEDSREEVANGDGSSFSPSVLPQPDKVEPVKTQRTDADLKEKRNVNKEKKLIETLERLFFI
ncbi:hypothetical protein VKT23_018158 [Stygiomarasmius scandens]|uniref:Uncharacterized protein n=1 Tax=Marasmiellus scandens TaxID=2682957 RepID=A0ABR1IS76_9AGAR